MRPDFRRPVAADLPARDADRLRRRRHRHRVRVDVRAPGRPRDPGRARRPRARLPRPADRRGAAVPPAIARADLAARRGSHRRAPRGRIGIGYRRRGGQPPQRQGAAGAGRALVPGPARRHRAPEPAGSGPRRRRPRPADGRPALPHRQPCDLCGGRRDRLPGAGLDLDEPGPHRRLPHVRRRDPGPFPRLSRSASIPSRKSARWGAARSS